MYSVEPFHPYDIRIGDLVGLMIFAKYLKVIEHIKHLTYNLYGTRKFIDSSLNIEYLFNDLIDEFVLQENQNALIPNCSRKNVRCIWITVPSLIAKFGYQILPNLNLNDQLYTGPKNLLWGEYICFSPLLNVDYNSPREMNVSFCNNLIDELFEKYKDRLLVITDQPTKIFNKHINCYVDSNLYNILYIISKSRIFIGGDTGFIHFAGLCRPRGIISIYPKQLEFFNRLRDCEYPLSYWSSIPAIDRSQTAHLFLEMINNLLVDTNQIFQFIDLIDKEKCHIETGEWDAWNE